MRRHPPPTRGRPLQRPTRPPNANDAASGLAALAPPSHRAEIRRLFDGTWRAR